MLFSVIFRFLPGSIAPRLLFPVTPHCAKILVPLLNLKYFPAFTSYVSDVGNTCSYPSNISYDFLNLKKFFKDELFLGTIFFPLEAILAIITANCNGVERVYPCPMAVFNVSPVYQLSLNFEHDNLYAQSKNLKNLFYYKV